MGKNTHISEITDKSFTLECGLTGLYDEMENKRLSTPMPQSDLAFRLIAENKSTQGKKLDLSNCGLREVPAEVTTLHWLEELNLSTSSYYDDDLKRYSASPTLSVISE